MARIHGPARLASLGLSVLSIMLSTAGPVRGATPAPSPSPMPECEADTAGGPDATVYLSMDDGTLGIELWAVDAATEAFRLVADLHPNGHGDPEFLGLVGGRLLFTADDGVHGRQLMASDGRVEGTLPLAAGPLPVESIRIPDDWDELDDPIEIATSFIGTLGDIAVLTLGREREVELWRTDGIPSGTTLIRTIPRAGDVRPVASTDGLLHFTDGTAHWVTDGTPDGTQLFAGTAPTDDDPSSYLADGPLEAGAHRFVFDWQQTPGAGDQLGAPAPNGPHRAWIAVAEGPGAGIRRLHRLPASAPGFVPAFVGPLGDRVVVAAAEVLRAGRGYPDIGLWVSDGTRRGTMRLARLPSRERSWSGDSIAQPWLLHTVSGGTMFLVARSGSELWQTDGTRPGTARIATGRVAELLAVPAVTSCPAPPDPDGG